MYLPVQLFFDIFYMKKGVRDGIKRKDKKRN